MFSRQNSDEQVIFAINQVWFSHFALSPSSVIPFVPLFQSVESVVRA